MRPPFRCQTAGVDLGRIGVWTSFRPFGAARAGEAARLAEELGFGTSWVGGSRLGPGALVAPELGCVVDPDPVRAREVARRFAAAYLGMRNYRRALLEVGFTDADLADGGSDRLIDAVVPQGEAARIAEVVHAHLDAGADHVCLQPLGEEGIPRASWTALARVLIR
jgi:hypothetical protein